MSIQAANGFTQPRAAVVSATFVVGIMPFAAAAGSCLAKSPLSSAVAASTASAKLLGSVESFCADICCSDALRTHAGAACDAPAGTIADACGVSARCPI